MLEDATPYRHDAFISYATVVSGRLGAALEHRLTVYGRRWDAPAAMDVYRDLSDQSAVADLKTELLAHLDGSEWLIYLASPYAAQSKWVQQEIAYWLKHKSRDRILIGISEGEILWDQDAARFNPAVTTCLPPDLLAPTAIPKWVDFRLGPGEQLDPEAESFVDKVVDFAATIRGIRKEELISLHWAEYRKGIARRTARHAAASLESDPPRALLLAAAANELDDVPETRDTLAHVLDACGGLIPAEGAHGRVTCMARPPASNRLVLGHADGAIDVLTVGGSHDLVYVPREGIGPISLGVGDGGISAGYSDGVVVSIWEGGGSAVKVHDEPIECVAPKGDGHVVACASRDRVLVVDMESGALRAVPGKPVKLEALRWSGDVLVFCDWGHVKSFDPSGAVAAIGTAPPLARPGPRAFTPGLDWMAAAQLDGGGVMRHPVPQTFSADAGAPAFVQGPVGFIDALAIDESGEHVALAAGGELLSFAFGRPDTAELRQGGLPREVLQLVVAGPGPGVGGWVAIRGRERTEIRMPARSALCRTVPVAGLEVPSAVQDVIAVAFSPSSDLVVWVADPTGMKRPTLSTWRIAEWSPGPRCDLQGLPPRALRFLSPEQLLIELHTNQFLQWDIGDKINFVEGAGAGAGAVVAPQAVSFVDGDEIVDSVSWTSLEGALACRSTSGRLGVVALLRSGRLTLRDVEAREDRWTVATACFSAIAISDDERTVAGINARGDVYLMDVATGNVAGSIRGRPSARHRLAFSPSGATLACAGVGGVLSLIDVARQSWIADARTRAGRALTATELEELGLNRLYLP